MGLFDKILSLFRKPTRVTGLYGYSNSSARFNKEAWDNDIFRATVDAIATHAAKGQIKHVVMDKEGRIVKVEHSSPYAKLLNVRPNPIMTAFEFKYRMIAQLETKTTAIAYIKWNGTTPEMIIPVDYSHYTMFALDGGGYCFKVLTYEGKEYYFDIEDCVVLRKFYNTKDASGDGNEPIYQALAMSKASDDGFIESLKTANKIRGIIKNKISMLDKADVKKSQEDFAARFKDAAENGGVVSVDSSEDYIPINSQQYSANNDQMKTIANRIYTFLRTPEAVVQGTYSETIGMAWYEGKIEPIWQMFSEALTNAFFTKREKEVGNRMIISGGVVMGTSYQTRLALIRDTKELGILTTNEQRELIGFGPIEGGDKRQVSLNYVDADKQNEYQLGAEPTAEDQEDKDGQK